MLKTTQQTTHSEPAMEEIDTTVPGSGRERALRNIYNNDRNRKTNVIKTAWKR